MSGDVGMPAYGTTLRGGASNFREDIFGAEEGFLGEYSSSSAMNLVERKACIIKASSTKA